VTLAELRQIATCPHTAAAARAHHDAVKADVATGEPWTPHGRHMLATLRPWPGLGQLGECLCLSSLLITDEPEDGDEVSA
jgi:hypothetical protein